MMGGDMANVKNSNLKVPPLKIVLSSATSGGSDRSSSTSPSSESESLDSNLTIISENQQQQERSTGKSSEQSKDESVNQGKLDKLARQAARSAAAVGADQKSATNSATIVSGSKRSQDNNSEIPSNCSSNSTGSSSSGGGASNNHSEPTANREQTTSSNQRITRSSQRAAQQNKSESETNGDETNLIETQDINTTTNNHKTSSNETGQRKVKRRKGEVQESEQDTNQQVPQQPIIMANFCPANYQLPTQNSFELYRDIRNRPYTKMMQLNLVQPRMPQGFKEYLLHSGPYLLDGNKVGVGVGGSKLETRPVLPSVPHKFLPTSRTPNCVPNDRNKKPLVNLATPGDTACARLANFYKIPKPADIPKHLKQNSPLCELFQDQERARHKMRIQHLKERERSVLSAEQEILRAYNRVAIADSGQGSHLSACTYFYYQERYHYIDEKSNYLDSINQKDSTQGRENSDSCNAENSGAERLQTDGATGASETTRAESPGPVDTERVRLPSSEPAKVGPARVEENEDGGAPTDFIQPAKKRKGEPQTTDGNQDKEAVNGSRNGCDTGMDNNRRVAKSSDRGPDGDKATKGKKAIETNKCDDTEGGDQVAGLGQADGKESAKLDKNAGEHSGAGVISDADMNEENKTSLISSLNEIDEKWTKIREEMFVRHKNESDSLYAVQCLEWEWKAKEIGACDVRLSPRIDLESVSRVEVSPLDY